MKCIDNTRVLARDALDAVIRGLEERGYQVARAGIVLGASQRVPSIEAAFSSHVLAHAAEGDLFRTAIRWACEQRNLPVIGFRERELFARGASDLSLSLEELRRLVSEMGRPLGSPWRQDEKQAALVAWLALAATSKRDFVL